MDKNMKKDTTIDNENKIQLDKKSESAIQIDIANGDTEYSEKEKKPRLKKLTDWKNEPTFAQLKYDYDLAQTDHQAYLADLYRWRENLDGGKPINAGKNKSKARPKLIRKQAEWKYPALEEPFLSTENIFDIRPRTFEDSFRAEQNKIYINYQWSVKVNRGKLINEIVRKMVNEGTAIVKSGWEIGEKEIKVFEEKPVFATAEQSFMILTQQLQSGQIDEVQMQEILNSGSPMQIGTKRVEVEKTVLSKNQPTYEVCDNESIILDPTANGDSGALKFIIHEYETDMSELKKDEFSEDTYIDDVSGERVAEVRGKYKNLDYITDLDKIDSTSQNSNVYKTRTQFNFDSGDTRRKFKAYDYWGYWDINNDGVLEPIVATWVGSTLIRLQKNPFPHKQLPFSFGIFMPRFGEVRGEPEGELLEENQEQIGRMTRAINDMVSTQAIGQTFIDDQFFPSRVEKDNYNEGRTVYYRHNMDPKQAIYHRKVEPIDGTTLQIINMNNAEAESLTGTKAFSQGMSSNSLGSVAAGIRSAMDATSKRDLSVLRRMSSELITDLGKKTIAMNQAYIDEKEMVRVTNSEFITVKREDIEGDFDLIVDVSTAEKDNETAQDLGFILQTNAANMDPNLAKIVLSKIMKLKKQPDLAQQILEFQPTPDPIVEQIKMLQLENEKMKNEKLKKEIEELDSRIHERVSRVLENEQDVGTKKANEEVLIATANKINAEADELNRKFVDNVTGSARQKEVEDHIMKADTEYNKMRIKMEQSNSRSESTVKQ